MFIRLAALAALSIAATTPLTARAVDVSQFVKKEVFETIKISPNGEFYAATIPLADTTALAIMRRSDNKLTASFGLGKFRHVETFHWVSPTRVLITASRKFGALDQPLPDGQIYGINADGTGTTLLVGQEIQNDLGTLIKPKKVEMIAAYLIDDLPRDDKTVLIAVSPFNADAFTRVDRMDVITGRRTTVARAPVRNATFTTDHDGVVRFASGAGSDLVGKLYYRAGEGKEWTLVNDEAQTERVEAAVGFSRDNAVAYLVSQRPTGPNAIVALDVASGTRKDVLVDAKSDPSILTNHESVPIGASYLSGVPSKEFFDAASTEARLYRMLEAAFPGQSPYITSTTADGKLALVAVHSDRNPGDFYVFDTVAKKANHLISRSEWFDPEKMAAMRPITLTARDGLLLHGFLTVPQGASGKNMPLVVMPHGGPYDLFDVWGFNTTGQLLAAAGYAVLQVNFRGSGNYGRAFTQAGANQWGGKMQDDVTDATRWAIREGFADASRICIFGASYGGYAALMGVAKEQGLYKCAAGYIGVYDLPTMHTSGDIQRRGSGETFLNEWIGSRETLGAVSPNRMADRIKVPVFLAAGGEDERAPIAHSKMMERALIAAGTPVETLYYPTEGHGFYREEHRKEFYTRLLAFLGRHIGGATASGVTASK